MTKVTTIMWFRQDLRIQDNPALDYANNLSNNIIPVFIWDTNHTDKIGSASKIWLYHSLNSLNSSLSNKLNYFIGDPSEIILLLAKKYQSTNIVWNRCYEEWQIKRDSQIKSQLLQSNIKVDTFNASLLWEPFNVLKTDNTPYKVFTPFYQKGCLNAKEPRVPTFNNANINLIEKYSDIDISQLNLLPNHHNWHNYIIKDWDISETGAQNLLNKLIESKVNQYKTNRDYPSIIGTSLLSPYIHFGQISPHQIYYAIKHIPSNDSTECYISELGWREFSYNLLYHNPAMPEKNLNPKFNKFKWNNDKNLFKLWQQGKTGIPIVDAGMRQLWQTGYMHNRVRMIVGSFLTKNLLIDWQFGAKWFFDTLFDADLASNTASWQWVAGSGTDAAPYFRIFNPILQSQKFDPEGIYIRKYVPELSKLPTKYIFDPANAPIDVLEQSNIKMGVTYPHPIVNLQDSRRIALERFEALKNDE